MRTPLIAATLAVAAVAAGGSEVGRFLLESPLAAASGRPTTAPACLAAPVGKRRLPWQKSQRADVVKAGPFTGIVWRRYDVVGGRFRLHVGDWRDRRIHLTQKIPWYLSQRFAVGSTLIVRGRLETPRRSFRQQFQRAGNTNTPHDYLFPTDIHPPTAGCWRLSLSSGRVTGSVTVLVRG